MRRLSLDDTRRLRAEGGRTVLLFLTDRCPVGCRHCSVDSRPDSPRITDWQRLREVLAGIAALPSVEVVAISGGEPFAEPRGLREAVASLRAAAKDVVLFTSGYWASANRPPPAWIGEVLRQTATVFLSTDAFHGEKVPAERFSAALRHITHAGCHIVVQALNQGPDLAIALAGLKRAFGSQLPASVELNLIRPLSRGRGAGLFQITRRHSADAFGACDLLGSPTVRYDGTVLPCCNESLITGHGPRDLRRAANSATAVGEALDELRADRLLQLIGTVGPGPVATLPGFGAVAAGRYTDVCGACWAAHRTRAGSDRARAVVDLVGQRFADGGRP